MGGKNENSHKLDAVNSVWWCTFRWSRLLVHRSASLKVGVGATSLCVRDLNRINCTICSTMFICAAFALHR